VSNAGDAVTAAYVTELRRDDGPAYRIEPVPMSGRIEGIAACSGWSVQFESATSNHIRGGEPLSDDLPWVFGEQDEGLFRFLGQGSVKTRYPKCLVAIPESMAVSLPRLADAIEGVNRFLVETTGDLEISAADSRFHVRVAQPREDIADVSFDGEPFTLVADGREVFHGLPSVFVTDADGRRQAVRPDLLQWKPIRGRDWKPWSETCCGRVSVRLLENGETRFQRAVEVVPKSLQFRMLPRSMNEGGIEIKGFGGYVVVCNAPEFCTCTVDRTDDSVLIGVRCDTRPPAAIGLNFDFGEGRSLTLPLPFPCRGARFVASGDSVLRYEACVYVESLTEYRVEGYGAREADQRRTDQFLVEGVLEANDIPAEVASRTWAVVPFSPTGRQLLELRTMVRPVRDLLSQTRDLDAYVTLRIEGPDVRHAKIVIKRYDRVFTIGADGVAIREETDGHAVFDGDRYRVDAVRLWDPAAGRERLDFNTDTNRWIWRPEGRDVGPWLLIGWAGGAARVRPALAPVEGDVVDDRSPLQRAVCLDSGPAVKQALSMELARLVLAPLDPDWNIISATLRLAVDVPPTSLVLANAVAREPRAAVLALIHAGEDRQLVWDAMESLRFEWFLVPVKDWVEVLPRYATELNTLVGEAAPNLASDRIASVIDFIDASTERALLKPLGELLRYRLLGVRPESLFMTSADRRSRTNDLTTLRQAVLTRNNEKTWPSGMMIRRWLDANHTGTVLSLLAQSGDMPSFRKVILTAPILVADGAAAGRAIDRDTLFEIRQARRFDTEWFDRAYAIVLQILLADSVSDQAVMV
ncbi:MAG: STY4851/ECs_5259 family protein, partial [Acidobacteriota bacterium]